MTRASGFLLQVQCILMKELPTFNGYTVDVRLREFRRADPEIGLEVVPFDSVEGQRLVRNLDFLAYCVSCSDMEPAQGEE
jgi:hypothetical protein